MGAVSLTGHSARRRARTRESGASFDSPASALLKGYRMADDSSTGSPTMFGPAVTAMKA
jgi:hypothetical protein